MSKSTKHDKAPAEKPAVDPRSQAHRTSAVPPSYPPVPKDSAGQPAVEQPARPPAKQEIPTKDLLWPKEPG